jgi:hypothetical protein
MATGRSGILRSSRRPSSSATPELKGRAQWFARRDTGRGPLVSKGETGRRVAIGTHSARRRPGQTWTPVSGSERRQLFVLPAPVWPGAELCHLRVSRRCGRRAQWDCCRSCRLSIWCTTPRARLIAITTSPATKTTAPQTGEGWPFENRVPPTLKTPPSATKKTPPTSRTAQPSAARCKRPVGRRDRSTSSFYIYARHHRTTGSFARGTAGPMASTVLVSCFLRASMRAASFFAFVLARSSAVRPCSSASSLSRLIC